MDYLDEYKDEQDKMEALTPELREAVEWIAKNEGIPLLYAYNSLSEVLTGDAITFDQIIKLWLKEKE